MRYRLTSGSSADTASRLCDEVVTPKNRAPLAPEYSRLLTAAWQNSRRTRATPGRRLPDRNPPSGMPAPVLSVQATVAKSATVRDSRPVLLRGYWKPAVRPISVAANKFSDQNGTPSPMREGFAHLWM